MDGSQTKINDRSVCAVGELKVELKQDAQTATKTFINSKFETVLLLIINQR
jgi:hypothetical protein